MKEQNRALNRDDCGHCSTSECSRHIPPETSFSLPPQAMPDTSQSTHNIKQEYFENDQFPMTVKTEFELAPPNLHNIAQSVKVKVKEGDHSHDKDCGCDECVVNRELDIESLRNQHNIAQSVKVEVKEEDHSNCGFDECAVKRELDFEVVDTGRHVKRQKTEPANDEDEVMVHDDRGDDAEAHDEGELNGDDQQGCGHIGPFQDVQVNETAEVNVIQKDGADQIEVQHLSDIDYELEMLQSVFIKSIGNCQFDGQFVCYYPQCGKQFGPDKQLAHLKLHTKPNVCDYVGCLRRFTGRTTYNAHKRSHNNVLECDLPGCVKRFQNIGTLNLHKRDHTDKAVLICEWRDCDKVLYSEAAYPGHLLTHSDDGIDGHRFVCDWAQCARKLTTQFNLSIHRQLHLGQRLNITHPRPFACDQCEANFTQNAHLVEHLRKHTTKRTFTCTWPECNQVFTSSHQLKSHSQVHDCPFVCEQCSARFTQDSHLVTHQLTHTAKHPFTCTWPECNQVFTSSHQLKSHSQVHDCPFVCEQCSARFTQDSHLVTHQLTHTAKHPFTCTWPECGQVFTSSTQFKKHSQVHVCAECSECGQVFSGSSYLTNHARVHSNVSPFVCDLPNCTKTFKWRKSLLRHQEKTQH